GSDQTLVERLPYQDMREPEAIRKVAVFGDHAERNRFLKYIEQMVDRHRAHRRKQFEPELAPDDRGVDQDSPGIIGEVTQPQRDRFTHSERNRGAPPLQLARVALSS